MRNCSYHGRQCFSANNILHWSSNFLKEFQNSTSLTFVAGTGPSNHPSWSPPPEGSYKLNVDVVINHNKGICGLGYVIWDYQCSILDAFSKLWHFPFDVKVDELMVIIEGLKFAREGGWTPVYVVSDCASVIVFLNSNSRIFNDLGVLINETLFWANFHNYQGFSFSFRSTNSVAHLLARWSINFNSSHK
ncbi:hypothetical protein UlMin_029014 [Ulmus minor]